MPSKGRRSSAGMPKYEQQWQNPSLRIHSVMTLLPMGFVVHCSGRAQNPPQIDFGVSIGPDVHLLLHMATRAISPSRRSGSTGRTGTGTWTPSPARRSPACGSFATRSSSCRPRAATATQCGSSASCTRIGLVVGGGGGGRSHCHVPMSGYSKISDQSHEANTSTCFSSVFVVFLSVTSVSSYSKP